MTNAGPADANPSNDVAVDELTYGEALAELEELLIELEDADIDVDRLTERVARGAELVRYCQERLTVVSSDVDNVVADLAGSHTETEETEETEAE